MRAFIGAVAVLLGATLAPISLAAHADDDVCSMACCIADGHCCCQPRRASVKGKPRDSRPEFANAELSKPCPEGCIVSRVSTNIFSRASTQTSAHPFTLIAAVAAFSQSSLSTHDDFCLTSSPPRAPPFSLLSA
jgi:hypothetical protein